jgi:hypothetical protein
MRAFLKLLAPLLILAAVTVNGVLTVAGWESESKLDENRALASAPEWTGNVDQFVRALDAWLTDHFYFRKALVSEFNEFLYTHFRSTLARNVVVGSGPWIFGAEFDGQRSVAPRQLSDEYKAKVKRALIERRAWLKERGIDMIVLFMPTKAAIYGNRYLPASWRFDPNFPTESEQVYEELADTMPESFVRVREVMQKASASANLYYYSDPHATQLGTFVAFQELETHIRKYFPEKAPSLYPPHTLKVDYYQPTAYGRMMGLSFKEESLVPVPEGGYRFVSPEPPEAAKQLPAGARLTYYENDQVRDVSAALIGDSFTNRMSAIFGVVFRRSAVVNVNNVSNDPAAKFPAAFLDAYRPDFAVFMYVESRLVECPVGCGEFPIENPPAVSRHAIALQ